MSKMPPRDRLYLGMACIFAVLFCVCCAYWWATPWFYLGCFLSVMLYWSNDHYWQVYNPVVTKMQLQWRMFYRAGGNNSSIASSSV
jgi:hypothetical protein